MEDSIMSYLRFHQMPEFASVMNNLFDRLPDNCSSNQCSYISVNIKENDNAYIIELLAPGFKKEDFKIELENNLLKVEADVKADSGDGQDKYLLKEFSVRKFVKTFTLPKNKVSDDNIEAKYDNGILSLQIVKLEEAKPKPAKLIEIA
jgi:HSP20 family protein